MKSLFFILTILPFSVFADDMNPEFACKVGVDSITNSKYERLEYPLGKIGYDKNIQNSGQVSNNFLLGSSAIKVSIQGTNTSSWRSSEALFMISYFIQKNGIEVYNSSSSYVLGDVPHRLIIQPFSWKIQEGSITFQQIAIECDRI